MKTILSILMLSALFSLGQTSNNVSSNLVRSGWTTTSNPRSAALALGGTNLHHALTNAGFGLSGGSVPTNNGTAWNLTAPTNFVVGTGSNALTFDTKPSLGYGSALLPNGQAFLTWATNGAGLYAPDPGGGGYAHSLISHWNYDDGTANTNRIDFGDPAQWSRFLGASNVFAGPLFGNGSGLTELAEPIAITASNALSFVNLGVGHALMNKVARTAGQKDGPLKVLVFGNSMAELSSSFAARTLGSWGETLGVAGVGIDNWDFYAVNDRPNSRSLSADTNWFGAYWKLTNADWVTFTNYNNAAGFYSDRVGAFWLSQGTTNTATLLCSTNGGAWGTLATLPALAAGSSLHYTNFSMPLNYYRLRVTNTGPNPSYFIGPEFLNTTSKGVAGYFVQIGGATLQGMSNCVVNLTNAGFQIQPDLVWFALKESSTANWSNNWPVLKTLFSVSTNPPLVQGEYFEQTATNARVANTFLRDRALTNGWAFFDPSYYAQSFTNQWLQGWMFPGDPVHMSGDGGLHFSKLLMTEFGLTPKSFGGAAAAASVNTNLYATTNQVNTATSQVAVAASAALTAAVLGSTNALTLNQIVNGDTNHQMFTVTASNNMMMATESAAVMQSNAVISKIKFSIPPGMIYYDDFERSNTAPGTLTPAPSIYFFNGTNHIYFNHGFNTNAANNYYITNGALTAPTTGGGACYPTIDAGSGVKFRHFGVRLRTEYTGLGSGNNYPQFYFICSSSTNGSSSLNGAYHFGITPHRSAGGVAIGFWNSGADNIVNDFQGNSITTLLNNAWPSPNNGQTITFQLWISGTNCVVDVGGYTLLLQDARFESYGGRYLTPEIFNNSSTNVYNLFVEDVWAGNNSDIPAAGLVGYTRIPGIVPLSALPGIPQATNALQLGGNAAANFLTNNQSGASLATANLTGIPVITNLSGLSGTVPDAVLTNTYLGQFAMISAQGSSATSGVNFTNNTTVSGFKSQLVLAGFGVNTNAGTITNLQAGIFRIRYIAGLSISGTAWGETAQGICSNGVYYGVKNGAFINAYRGSVIIEDETPLPANTVISITNIYLNTSPSTNVAAKFSVERLQ